MFENMKNMKCLKDIQLFVILKYNIKHNITFNYNYCPIMLN